MAAAILIDGNTADPDARLRHASSTQNSRNGVIQNIMTKMLVGYVFLCRKQLLWAGY